MGFKTGIVFLPLVFNLVILFCCYWGLRNNLFVVVFLKYWDPGLGRVSNMPTSVVIGCFVELVRGSSYLVPDCGGGILYSIEFSSIRERNSVP